MPTMRTLSRMLSILAAMAVGALLVIGGTVFAQAPAAPSGPNGAGGPQPQSVIGTSKGLPVSARVLWAVVNADGTLARGLMMGPAPSTHLSTGNYEVIFSQNMAGCAYAATIGNAATGTAPAGFITVAARAGNVNGVFVQTSDTTGALADRQFHLVVTC
jgi:hypothetical protein